MNSTRTNFITLILVTLFLFPSCQTVPQSLSVSSVGNGDVQGRIRQALSQGRAVTALVEYNDWPERDDHGELWPEILEALEGQFQEYLEQDRPDRARILRQTLERMDFPLSWEQPEDSINRQLLSYYQNSQWNGAAAVLLQDILGEQDWEREQLLSWLDYAREQGFVNLVREIQELLGLQASEQSTIPTQVSKQSLLQATVTILVNRGIQIEDGIGRPDLVIGSGFFIDRQGHLLTNYHVISSEVDPTYEGFSRLSVILPGSRGERLPARVVGWDKSFDLALLKVEYEPPLVFSFAPDQELELGLQIWALGSPGGLEASLTSGIVSSTNRRFLPMGEIYQVDVPINPGSSGGPLINDRGDVLGVVFAGIQEYEGTNFVIPGRYVRDLLPRLYRGGAVEHYWLGMGLQESSSGLEVRYLFPHGDAARRDVLVGDRLLAINGQVVDSIMEIQDMILRLDMDIPLVLSLQREGTSFETWMLLESRPASPGLRIAESDLRGNILDLLWGVRSHGLNRPFVDEYRIDYVYSGSMADRMNISENDVFQIRSWELRKEDSLLIVRLNLKTRLSGYMESVVQLPFNLEINSLI